MVTTKVDFTEVKALKVCHPYPPTQLYPLRLWIPEVSHCHISPHSGYSNLSKLLFKCFYQLMALAESVPDRLILDAILCIFLSVSLDFRVVVVCSATL